MVKNKSALIDFLSKAVYNEDYKNIWLESEGIFVIRLARKTKGLPDDDQKLLQGYFEMKNRRPFDYTIAKQVFRAALNSSPYLECIKKEGSAMWFKFQSLDEVEAKRKAKKLKTSHVYTSDILCEKICSPCSDISSGYGSGTDDSQNMEDSAVKDDDFQNMEDSAVKEDDLSEFPGIDDNLIELMLMSLKDQENIPELGENLFGDPLISYFPDIYSQNKCEIESGSELDDWFQDLAEIPEIAPFFQNGGFNISDGLSASVGAGSLLTEPSKQDSGVDGPIISDQPNVYGENYRTQSKEISSCTAVEVINNISQREASVEEIVADGDDVAVNPLNTAISYESVPSLDEGQSFDHSNRFSKVWTCAECKEIDHTLFQLICKPVYNEINLPFVDDHSYHVATYDDCAVKEINSVIFLDDTIWKSIDQCAAYIKSCYVGSYLVVYYKHVDN